MDIIERVARAITQSDLNEVISRCVLIDKKLDQRGVNEYVDNQYIVNIRIAKTAIAALADGELDRTAFNAAYNAHADKLHEINQLIIANGNEPDRYVHAPIIEAAIRTYLTALKEQK